MKHFLKIFRKNHELFLISLPGVLFYFVISYLPMSGIIIAFKNYRFDQGIFGSEWIGLKNFHFFFLSNDAWRITRNTVLYNASYIVLTTVTALAVAILLNELSKRWLLKIYQTSMFLPHFLSWILVGYITYLFLDVNNGFLNQILRGLGLKEVGWYLEAWPWPYILNLVHVWKSVGFSALVYYAGIIGIDTEYYEAARIDGASRWQMVKSITLPLLTPLIIILFILSIGSMFRGDFGLHYFIPNNSTFAYTTTDIIDTYVFRALRTVGDVSMSAAVGLYQSVVGFILVIVANYIVKKLNEENSLW